MPKKSGKINIENRNMEKVIVSLGILTILISCNKNPDNKVKENIEKYMADKMDDPKSYESVKTSILDSLFSPYEESEKALQLKSEDNDLYAKYIELGNKIDQTENISELDKIKIESNKITERRNQIIHENLENSLKFKGTFVGYKVNHIFRGKNKFGALILDSCSVVLDKNFEIKSIK